MIKSNKKSGYTITEPIFGKFGDWLVKLCNIDKGMSVLDAGCGIGVSTFPIAKKVGINGKISGVDISEELIREASKRKRMQKMKNMSFMVCNVEDLCFPDNTFDSVVSNLVLRQVNNRLKAIKEMKRVLKPGGYLGFTLPGPKHYKEFKKITAIVLNQDLFIPRKNCIQSDPDVLKFLLKEANISNVQKYSKVITTYIGSVDEYDAILETRGPKNMILHRIKENKQKIWGNILVELKNILKQKERLPLTTNARAIVWRKPS